MELQDLIKVLADAGFTGVLITLAVPSFRDKIWGNSDKIDKYHLETRDSIDKLRERTEDGFKGVHQRQDITNGRVAANSKDIAVLYERTNNKR